MAELKSKLPPYCVIKPRKGYDVIYFQVPEKLRPDGWKPAHTLGRTDHDAPATIIKRGNDLYAELLSARRNEDLKIDHAPMKGSLADVIHLYRKSEHWEVLKPATREGYIHFLKKIELWSKEAGHPHIRELKAPAIAAFLALWKDKPRARKFYKAMLSILFEQAIEHGYVAANVVKEIRLPKNNKKKRSLVLWEQHHVDTFVAAADAAGEGNLGTAVIIAFETGQRMTDIMRMMTPRDYKDGRFRFKASKTGKDIFIPATRALQARLASRPDTQLLLTVNDATGKQWTKDSLSHAFRDMADQAGLEGHLFRQIRNSAAIHAERADLTDAEFEAIFGWPKENVRKMLTEFYGDRDQTVANRAVEKLEEYRNRGKVG